MMWINEELAEILARERQLEARRAAAASACHDRGGWVRRLGWHRRPRVRPSDRQLRLPAPQAP
jgi:hypothetical protein